MTFTARTVALTFALTTAAACIGIVASRMFAFAIGLAGPDGGIPTPPGMAAVFVGLFMLVAGSIASPAVRRLQPQRGWLFALVVAASAMGLVLQTPFFELATGLWRALDSQRTEPALLALRVPVFGAVGGAAVLLFSWAGDFVVSNLFGIRRRPWPHQP